MTTIAPARGERFVSVWNGELDIRVKIAGTGPPLVYLHPAGGLIWDAFLDRLSERYTICAPEHPGTTRGNPDAIHKVDTFRDLLLIYEEMIRSLGLRAPVLVGQSYGGMMAADLAAHFPGAFSKLVLLDPIGLWRDDAPIPLMEFTSAMPDRQAAFLFHDPQCAAARALFTPPDDVEAAIAGGSAIVWALGCTGKFFWPIADHGLGKRLFRIAIPTLVVWGAQDTLVPPLYAQEFARGIRNSRVSIIENAGHVPQMEQTDATFAAVSAFLAS